MSDRVEQNLRENREQWTVAPYYDLAEPNINREWERWIWPVIRDADFSVTLELAPGHGRNTKMLAPHCRELHLVDLTPACIDACRARFGERLENAAVSYYVNDGRSLPEGLTNRVTLVYCWDAMVHFEKNVIENYIRAIERVLRPGGHAFLHHSDLKNVPGAQPGNWLDNPHWRSAVSKDEVRAAAESLGLQVVSQTQVPWGNGEIWDCVTFLRKPSNAA